MKEFIAYQGSLLQKPSKRGEFIAWAAKKKKNVLKNDKIDASKQSKNIDKWAS